MRIDISVRRNWPLLCSKKKNGNEKVEQERRKTERNYGNIRNDLFHQYTKLKWCCRSEISSLFTDNVNTLYKKWNVTSPKIKNDKMIEIIIGIKY